MSRRKPVASNTPASEETAVVTLDESFDETDTVHVFCDGSATTADCAAGAGALLVMRGEVLAEVAYPWKQGSNQFAELLAINKAIALAFALAPKMDVVVWSDSAFALGAVNPMNVWNVRDRKNRTLADRARKAIENSGRVTLRHIKGHGDESSAPDPEMAFAIRMNHRADALAKVARQEAIRRLGALRVRAVTTTPSTNTNPADAQADVANAPPTVVVSSTDE